jgi:hypothetical protein
LLEGPIVERPIPRPTPPVSDLQPLDELPPGPSDVGLVAADDHEIGRLELLFTNVVPSMVLDIAVLVAIEFRDQP